VVVLGQSQANGIHGDYRYLRTFSPKPDPHVLAFLRKRIDDCLSILDRHLQLGAFVVGNDPTAADISLMAYLHYPSDETGYVLENSHPAVHAWLGRMATLPGWHSAYDLLPGKRLDTMRNVSFGSKSANRRLMHRSEEPLFQLRQLKV
jgi:glutathione S-transferase